MMRWEKVAYVIQKMGIEDIDHLYIVDVDRFEHLHVPLFPPDLPVLVTGIHSSGLLDLLEKVLEQVYPPEHRVRFLQISGEGSSEEKNQGTVSLASIHELTPQDGEMALYLSPLGEQASFEGFSEIIAHLRDPQGGCPWDLKQTHQSLRTHLLSETYEVLTALDSEDDDAMAEELGDLLLQIVLHTQIASERRAFNITHVLEKVSTKIIGRHPHVFGDVDVADVQGVLRNWERLKAAERSAPDEQKDARPAKGLLDGVPLALPALTQAQEYLERTERVGLAWKTWQELIAEIEAILVVMHKADEDTRNPWLGKLLFNIANLASIAQLDAESSLREENQDFRKRLAAREP